MAKGWIKLHRSIMNNEMWLSEPFTKSQAWIDLLLLADHEDDGKYKAGCVYKSVSFFADRWKWSRGKVRYFFNQLENQQMIQRFSHPSGQVVTLVKYGFYQYGQPTKKPTKKPTNCTYTRNKEYNPPINGGIITDDDEDESTYIDPLELLKRDKEAGLL